MLVGLQTVVAVLACVWMAEARFTSMEWSDCGSHEAITMHGLDVSPMPVQSPGYIDLTINATSNRAVGELRIVLSIKRKGAVFSLPIPCLFHIGSCTYESSCTGPSVLDTMTSENWGQIGAELGPQLKTMISQAIGDSDVCPVPAPFDIVITQYRLNLPQLPSILSFMAAGDYDVRVNVIDKSAGSTLLCVAFGLTVEQNHETCTGLFCRN